MNSSVGILAVEFTPTIWSFRHLTEVDNREVGSLVPRGFYKFDDPDEPLAVTSAACVTCEQASVIAKCSGAPEGV